MRRLISGLAIVAVALSLEACPKPADNAADNMAATNEVMSTETVPAANAAMDNGMMANEAANGMMANNATDQGSTDH